MLADLEQAERRLERVVRAARGGDRAAIAEQAWLERLIEALARRAPGAQRPAARRRAGRAALARADHRQAGAVRRQRRRGRRRGARRRSPPTPPQAAPRAVAISARLESELGELDDRARRPRCAPSSASARRVSSALSRGAFELLDLIAFFTAGEAKPAQSWHLRRGLHRLARGRRDPLRHPARLRARRGRRLAGAARRRRLRRRPRARRAAARGPRLRDARRRRDHGQVHARDAPEPPGRPLGTPDVRGPARTAPWQISARRRIWTRSARTRRATRRGCTSPATRAVRAPTPACAR